MQEAGGGGGGGGPGGGGGLPPAGGGGPGPGTPWYAGLVPEGTEVPEAVKNAADLPALISTVQELKAYQGDSLRIPGPEATVEDRTAFNAKLAERVPGVYYMPDPEDPAQIKALQRKMGAPEDGNGYTFTPPEGGSIDEAMTAQYRTWANDLDMTQAQADGIYKRFNEYTLGEIGAMKGTHNEAINGLKAEWGVTFPDKVKKIDHLVGKYADTEGFRAELQAGNVPPHILKMFSQMADGLLGEGMQMVGTGGDQPPPGLPPAEAAERAAEVRNHPAFFDDAHPEHMAMVKKHVEYMKQAHPTASQEAPARAGLG
jgi:hypothetical protein